MANPSHTPDPIDGLQKRSFLGGLPSSYSKGERLHASTINTLMNFARSAAKMGIGFDGSFPIERPQMVKAENASGADIGPWQMVEITNSVAYNPEHGIEINTPSAASVELTAITADGIPNGYVGWVYTCGVALVEYTGVAVTGDRLGSQNGSTIAIEDGVSAWVVLGTTTVGATKYALVRFQPGAAVTGEIILRLNGGLPSSVDIDIPSTSKIGSVHYLGLDVDGKMILNFTTECYKVEGSTSMTTSTTTTSP